MGSIPDERAVMRGWVRKAASILLFLVILFSSTGFVQVAGSENPEGDCGTPNGDIPLDEAAYQAYLQPVTLAERDTLPAAYDARTEGIVTPAKNQGNCGSCWSFASVGAVESHLLAAGFSGDLDLSEQQQVSCNMGQYGCCGGSSTAIRYWESYGPINESCFSYGESGTSCSEGERTIFCSNQASCPQLDYRVRNFHMVSTSQFRESLWADGPSYFRFNVYSDFYDFWNNASFGTVYLNSGGSYLGGHAVLIIGWSEEKQAYLLKNSWGASSGPQGDGTFWMAYSGHAKNLGLQMANFDVVDISSPDDLYEQNDSMVDAYDFGEMQWLRDINGKGYQSDEDWYRLNVREGFEDLSILASFTHADGDINIKLFDDSGNLLNGSYSTDDQESLSVVVPGGGNYYLLVYGENAGNQYDLWWKSAELKLFLPLITR